MSALLPPSLHCSTLLLAVFCRCMWQHVTFSHVATEKPLHTPTPPKYSVFSSRGLHDIKHILYTSVLQPSPIILYNQGRHLLFLLERLNRSVDVFSHSINEPRGICNLRLSVTDLLSGVGWFYLFHAHHLLCQQK